jgi:OmcA/MtrC family decaheme c-type cytochrome
MEVVLTALTEDVEYMLTEATGAITETGGFGNGNPIVVTYTSDFIMPEVYPTALNDGPDTGERFGNWAGKSIVDGTYSVVMWGSQNLTLNLHGETNSYREGATGTRKDFLVGDASSIQPYDIITSVENCNACHVDIQFHGNNRRGFTACFACHATAGSGDRPQYVAANAPATDGVTINFRQMVHKIHRGVDLAKADTYSVNGFGSPAAYPNNFSEHMYDHVAFPSMPEGVMDCARCHGAGNDAWEAPTNRQHPTEQMLPAQEWNLACGSCHDSDAEQAHIQSQTSPIDGAESCLICHGAGQTWDVESMHQVR